MKIFKQISALFLALAVIFSMISINVYAESYNETEPYFYLYGDTPVAEFKDKSTWYWSSHQVDRTYIDGTTSSARPMMFPLLNMSTMETIKTYCLDSGVEVADIAEYRRLNIEDSTYFTKDVSAKIRAVFLNGFTDASQLGDIEAAANAWLASKGMDQIVDLTGGQALSATQAAIWMYSNAELSDVVYDGTYPAKNNWLVSMYDTVGVNPMEEAVIDADGNNVTEKNINLLIDYLMNLDGVAPSTVLVSDATLSDAIVSTPASDGNGGYKVNVSVNIENVRSSDNLFITIASGEKTSGGYPKSTTKKVTASGKVTLELAGLTEAEAKGLIAVELNGTQKGNDVYLYDAKGPRGSSQTMVGFDSSVMNVHAEAIFSENERILEIQKTQKSDGKPLANIPFTLYQVATAEEITSGTVVVGDIPSADDIAKYAVRKYELVTLYTDADGCAKYNFSRNSLPDGVYLVVENPTPAVKEVVAPFFVTIPEEKSTVRGEFNYTVSVKVENEIVYDAPGIDMSVSWLDNNSDTLDAGDEITWIIDSYIPFDIASGIEYVINTDIDDRTSHPTKITVSVSDFDEDKDVETLTEGDDYVLTIVPGTIGGGKLSVSLTETGRKKVAKTVNGAPDAYVIRIKYNNIMNETAKVGENIDNDATVDYTNSVGLKYTKKSELVEVHTGGVRVNKVDDAGNPVAGAVFKIVRKATETELADDNIEKIVIGGLSYVYVDFFATEKFDGEKVCEVITDGNGAALIYGIAYGEYFVTEAAVPDAYVIDETPVKVSVDANSHKTANAVKVVNNRKNNNPDTDDKMMFITVAMVVFFVVACGLFIISEFTKKEY